jgi:hypothetical protein
MSKGGYTPYPVVDADPTIGTSVMNFSLGEMLTIPAFTGGSMAYGYFLCKPSYYLHRHVLINNVSDSTYYHFLRTNYVYL